MALMDAKPQHLTALEQANAVRLARAALKREIAAGERTVADVVNEVPWEAESMTVFDLLIAQHRWGRMRARRFLASLPLAEQKTIGSMTDRQRAHFTARMEGTVAPEDMDPWTAAAFQRAIHSSRR